MTYEPYPYMVNRTELYNVRPDGTVDPTPRNSR
jgi:hypothetical protein